MKICVSIFKTLKNIACVVALALFVFASVPARLFADVSNTETIDVETAQLLDEIQKKGLTYFIEQRHPNTGLIRDWAWNTSSGGDSPAPATIAATGFAFSAYVMGVERGWLERGKAMAFVKQGLQFLKDGTPNEHGFFFHMLNIQSGSRASASELSPIDTALAVAGILFADAYFQDPEISRLADTIVHRVDWPWMLNNGKSFALAWNPDQGFDRRRWDHFDESLLMYLLAAGSETHPIPEGIWQSVRKPVGSYGGRRVIVMPPLFTHQFPQVWFDLREKNDGFADYFENARQVTLIHKQFALDQSRKFKTYGEHSWGLSAAEGPSGYRAYGAPPGWAVHDGTVVPSACASSIPFTPQASIGCIRHLYETHKNKLWGRYGFSDAFNLNRDWFSNKVFAINQGPMILMIENYRTGLIWNIMNRTEYVRRALKRTGFHSGTVPLQWPEAPNLTAGYSNDIVIDGQLTEWSRDSFVHMDEKKVESGTVTNNSDLSAFVGFAWNAEYLYAAARVYDDFLVLRSANQVIWRDDLLELYVDPGMDGLEWEGDEDYQLGFRIDKASIQGHVKGGKAWSWFAKKGDLTKHDLVKVKGRGTAQGYEIELAIPWRFFGLTAVPGMKIGMTPALHDLDLDRSEAKMILFWRNEEKPMSYRLPILELQPSPSAEQPDLTSRPA